jgi:peptide deformylase
LVVIDTGEGLIELINPEIIHADGLQNGVEGCLSLPGASGSVERPMKVKVRALDRNGKEFELVGTELLARAICHEVDHLEGILFTDRIKDKE